MVSTTLKLAIVDASRSLRDDVAAALAGADDICVTASLADCGRVMEFVQGGKVDVVAVEVGLPGSLELLQNIQQFNVTNDGLDVGVVLLAQRKARNAQLAIAALEAGAFDFVAKPDAGSKENVVAAVARQLKVKLRHFSSKRIFISMQGGAGRPTSSGRSGESAPLQGQVADGAPVKRLSDTQVILVGVSTGGPKVLSTLLPRISMVTDLPILIVQHMPPEFTASLAQSLGGKCKHRVLEAVDQLELADNHVYIAPGGKQMELKRNARQAPLIRISDDPPEDGCRPSVNRLFRSAASVMGEGVIGIILTGMGSDGAKGAGDLKRSGAFIIAQDKASSVVWGMPGSAVNAGHVDKILSPDEIPDVLKSLLQGS